MKLHLRSSLLLLIALPFFPCSAQSQPDHFTYAITSLKKDGTDWVALRRLDTRSGEFSPILMDGTDKTLALYDAVSRKKIDRFINDTLANSNPQLVFGSSVAAIAYDKEANRLYFTPMLVDQLRYIDLATMKVYCVTGQTFGKAGHFTFQPGTINRMVIAPDGYGYSITNDGNHLFRFSTNENPVITDLGELTDEATNNETIHNPCGNAGGDLVADSDGNLYLVSASNRVFKVDINTRRTQYLGGITGLPQKFTTNGASVDENGKLMISSSVYTDAYFSVDPKTWAASPYLSTNLMYSSADLANSNALFSTNNRVSKIPVSKSYNIKAYPNPVATDEFNVQFTNLKPGNYTVQLSDAVGNGVLQQKVKVTQLSQTENIHLPAANAQGFYFLRIVDESNGTVFTQIMVVQR